MTMRRHRRAAAALALVGALALTGCSGDGEATTPETVTVTADAAAGEGDTTAEGTGDAGGTDEATGGEETEDVVEPAEQQTIEINEERAKSGDWGGYTLTVHRVTVQDYYVEAEITIVNDSPATLPTWWGGNHSRPRLYDDRGREYRFQVQAGGDGDRLSLEGGEGLNAVLVFAGKVDADARSLTLDLSELGGLSDVDWGQMTFDIALGNPS